MNNFLRFCSIVSIIIATIKLAMIGNLSHGTVIFIITAVMLILIGSRTVYIVTAAIAAMWLFLKVYGHGNAAIENSLLQAILTLAFVCFGMYLLFRGIIPPVQKRRR